MWLFFTNSVALRARTLTCQLFDSYTYEMLQLDGKKSETQQTSTQFHVVLHFSQKNIYIEKKLIGTTVSDINF